MANLQALCYTCNAMKRDRDDTDFRAVRAACERNEPGCPFCSTGDKQFSFQSQMREDIA
jgi:ATP adenylyltransferase